MRTCLCICLLAAFVTAQEETPAPLKRGFAEGKFTDDYFGIVYTAKELKEGFMLGGPTTLFAGRCAGGVDVEVLLFEAPREVDAAGWLALTKQSWAQDGQERTEMEEGAEPRPWALFVQESLAGFKRQHGYAFHARGLQCFQVHASVMEKSETSGAAIKEALGGLTVAEKSDSLLFAHLVAKQSGGSPTDPLVLLQAGNGYVQGQRPNPILGLRALAQAESVAKPETFNDDQRWQLASGKGLALLTMRRLDESVPVWQSAVELAKKTMQPAELESNSRYNLACAYSLAGKLDEAFDQLKKSLSMGNEQHVSGLRQHSQTDPDLENMRKDERWAGMGAPGQPETPGGPEGGG